jgi:hypothetical protein
MWPWIKRWRDWAMHKLWPLTRSSPQQQAMHYSFEKAGLTLTDQPIPWSAEAVLVEAILRLPGPTSRRKVDYALRLVGRDPVPAEQFRPIEGGSHRVLFRCPPLNGPTTAELLFRGHILARLPLPFLGRDEFVRGLQVQMPTLSVRLGEAHVACQTFVSSQCKGVLASAVLSSPTSLVPLLDLDLQLELRCQRTGSTWRTPVTLSASQVGGRQALVSVQPRRFPRRMGAWLATWLLSEQPLAVHRIRAISQRMFYRSLRLFDTRFVVQRNGKVSLQRQVPAPGAERVGPCFLVCSSEPGMAGLVDLEIAAHVSGAVRPPLLQESPILITDGPTPVAPGTLDVADLTNVLSFDLSVKGRQLGTLPLCPAPTAAFTSEGGFKAPSDFSWSPAAEEEMNERLSRLIGGESKS